MQRSGGFMPAISRRIRMLGLFRAAVSALALASTATIPQGQITIGRNIKGVSLSGSGEIPPDTMGAVGVDHVAEFVNGRFVVWRKSDSVAILGEPDTNFWGAAGVTFTGGLSDPRLIYDHRSGRWFASQIDF